MDLRDCFLGILVKQINPTTKYEEKLIGHIVGLDTNLIGEVIVRVKWSDSTEVAIHPSKLTQFN